MNSLFQKKKTWAALLLIAISAGVAWWQHGPILAWYYVHQLAGASEAERDNWGKKVAALDQAAVPRLLDGLRDADPGVCANMQCPLHRIAKSWGVNDPRLQDLLERMHARFDQFSPSGQEECLGVVTGVLHQAQTRPLPPRLTRIAGQMLVVAEKKNELRAAALHLAAELIECVEPGQWADVAREIADRSMKDEAAPTRVAALRLIMRPALRNDKDLIEKAVPMLRDPAAAVRKAALVVLASERDVVREESFLPLLHDDDAEVQYLCETALRKRGLLDDDIKMARMISDANPATRMLVLYHLHRMPDINIGGLLRQLSLDASPAVRAAAARAAAECASVDLSERLREMSQSDPHDLVRRLAQYHLQHRERRQRLGEMR